MHMVWCLNVPVMAVLFCCFFTVVSLVQGSYIDVPTSVIDVGFHKLDKDGDGVLSLQEFDAVVTKDDTNGDGCVSRAEYEAGAPVAHALTDKMFEHFEYQHSGCLVVQEMIHEFHIIDTNSDGKVLMAEYESYFKHLMVTLFGISQ